MTVWLEVDGRQRRVELPDGLSNGEEAVECVVDGRKLTVKAWRLQPGVLSLIVVDGVDGEEAGRQYRCVLDGSAVVVDGRRHGFEVADPRSLKARRGSGAGTDGPRAIKAPMPGRVVRVLVAVGDEVAEQQGLVVTEAMKMQNELKSPKVGRVVRVAAAVGDTVGAGDVLAVVE
jgi:biotin carboxyl carrier protein